MYVKIFNGNLSLYNFHLLLEDVSQNAAALRLSRNSRQNWCDVPRVCRQGAADAEQLQVFGGAELFEQSLFGGSYSNDML